MKQLTLMMVLLSIACGFACTPTEGAAPPAPSATPVVAPPSEPKAEPVPTPATAKPKVHETTADALCREYQKDPNGIRQKYSGNHVRVTGKVERTELGGVLFVTKRDKKAHFSCVDAYAIGSDERPWEHASAWKSWLATVKPRTSVTVLCEEVEPTAFGVMLSHCFGGSAAGE